jgi:hypothetical protein
MGSLKQQARDPGLDDNDFRRHHLNQWTPPQNAHRSSADTRVPSPRGEHNTDAQLEQLLNELKLRYPPPLSATTATSSAPPTKGASN